MYLLSPSSVDIWTFTSLALHAVRSTWRRNVYMRLIWEVGGGNMGVGGGGGEEGGVLNSLVSSTGPVRQLKLRRDLAMLVYLSMVHTGRGKLEKSWDLKQNISRSGKAMDFVIVCQKSWKNHGILKMIILTFAQRVEKDVGSTTWSVWR